jgi:hypothetical protein
MGRAVQRGDVFGDSSPALSRSGEGREVLRDRVIFGVLVWEADIVADVS